MSLSKAKARDILGVNHKADESEIKSAFRKLAMKVHPDKGGDRTKFEQAAQAYELLKKDFSGAAKGTELNIDMDPLLFEASAMFSKNTTISANRTYRFRDMFDIRKFRVVDAYRTLKGTLDEHAGSLKDSPGLARTVGFMSAVSTYMSASPAISLVETGAISIAVGSSAAVLTNILAPKLLWRAVAAGTIEGGVLGNMLSRGFFAASKTMDFEKPLHALSAGAIAYASYVVPDAMQFALQSNAMAASVGLHPATALSQVARNAKDNGLAQARAVGAATVATLVLGGAAEGLVLLQQFHALSKNAIMAASGYQTDRSSIVWNTGEDLYKIAPTAYKIGRIMMDRYGPQ